MSEWGNWQVHDGKHCPIGMYVQAKEFETDDIWEGVAGQEAGATDIYDGGWLWALRQHSGMRAGDAIEYRIRKPKGLTILESILNGLPAPTKPTVPA